MVCWDAILLGSFEAALEFLDHTPVSHLTIIVCVFDVFLAVADVVGKFVIDIVIRCQPVPSLA